MSKGLWGIRSRCGEKLNLFTKIAEFRADICVTYMFQSELLKYSNFDHVFVKAFTAIRSSWLKQKLWLKYCFLNTNPDNIYLEGQGSSKVATNWFRTIATNRKIQLLYCPNDGNIFPFMVLNPCTIFTPYKPTCPTCLSKWPPSRIPRISCELIAAVPPFG